MKVALDIRDAFGKREERTIEVNNLYEAEIAANAIAVSEHKGVVIGRAKDVDSDASEDLGGFLKRLLGG